MKALLIILLIMAGLHADCKITKQTYNMENGKQTCVWSSYWQEGYVGAMYKAESYNIEVDSSCYGVKFLKGKIVKKEVIDEIIGRDCLYTTEGGGRKGKK